ncbi:hypothetical protein CK936_22650 [Streptomyces albireticuli]|uniref:Uncharacterized protein n=1 Tax=Streptomyces albireticuli TaxID=1940 RepID=A0A2A2D5C4_9ACTN|nr:hypothetical protein CK936_22650 [Streptomyces albireticuli]
MVLADLRGDGETMVNTAADTDARMAEYDTYAPKGETCPECLKPLDPLEGCRRGMLARRDASPVVAYWHRACVPGAPAPKGAKKK